MIVMVAELSFERFLFRLEVHNGTNWRISSKAVKSQIYSNTSTQGMTDFLIVFKEAYAQNL